MLGRLLYLPVFVPDGCDFVLLVVVSSDDWCNLFVIGEYDVESGVPFVYGVLV